MTLREFLKQQKDFGPNHLNATLVCDGEEIITITATYQNKGCYPDKIHLETEKTLKKIEM